MLFGFNYGESAPEASVITNNDTSIQNYLKEEL